jgi:hypothetical protein
MKAKRLNHYQTHREEALVFISEKRTGTFDKCFLKRFEALTGIFIHNKKERQQQKQ